MAESERRPPTPAAALALFAAVLVSNVVLGFVSAATDFDENWLLLATPLVVLSWTALAVWFFRVDAREALLLRLPPLSDLFMAVPLAISFVVLSDQLSSLTEGLVPVEFREAFLRMVRATTPVEWFAKIATIGVGAAVSEELLFRGFIQSAFLRAMSRSAAVVWTAFLFMALHVLPLPSFAAAGIVLGFTALATRSILIPIVIHFVNNAAAIALVNLAELETLGDPVWIPPSILLPALGIFVLTMGFYARRLLPEPGGTASSEEVATSEAPERDRLGSSPPSLAEELSSVPRNRRRLGWVVVLVAVLIGTSVLLGLFMYSLYMMRPQAVHATFIETLSSECRADLSPEASHRAADLDAAFEALAAANEQGGLTWRHLIDVVRSYAETSADGRIEPEEVDVVIEAIRGAVGDAMSPRRL